MEWHCHALTNVNGCVERGREWTEKLDAKWAREVVKNAAQQVMQATTHGASVLTNVQI